MSQDKLMGFVMTSDAARARAFYEGVLGIRVQGEDPYALVLDSNGTMVRVSKTDEVKPTPHTVLGWEVADIAKRSAELRAKGVTFERYEFLQQDGDGIWTAPGGTRVAWFKDPDGNVLSLTQF